MTLIVYFEEKNTNYTFVNSYNFCLVFTHE